MVNCYRLVLWEDLPIAKYGETNFTDQEIAENWEYCPWCDPDDLGGCLLPGDVPCAVVDV